MNLPTIPSGPLTEVNVPPTEPKQSTKENPFADLQLPPSPFDEQTMKPPKHEDRPPEELNQNVQITTTKVNENVIPSTIPPAPEIQHMPEEIQKPYELNLLEPEKPPPPEPQKPMNDNPYGGLPTLHNPLERGQVQPPNSEQPPQIETVNDVVKPPITENNVDSVPISANPAIGMGIAPKENPKMDPNMQGPQSKDTNVEPGLPNSFFGPDSTSDPDPFANLPKELLEQAVGPNEPRPSEKIPNNPVENENIGTQQGSRPKLSVADFEAEEALFNKYVFKE